MEVRITARHFDLTDDLKEFAEMRMRSLTRYFDKIIDAHLKLDVEKYRHTADLNTTVYGAVLFSSANSNDMYASVDEAINKMEGQVKKHKSRLKDRDQRRVAQMKVPRESSVKQEEEQTEEFEDEME